MKLQFRAVIVNLLVLSRFRYFMHSLILQKLLISKIEKKVRIFFSNTVIVSKNRIIKFQRKNKYLLLQIQNINYQFPLLKITFT